MHAAAATSSLSSLLTGCDHSSPKATNDFVVLAAGIAVSLALEPPLHIRWQSHVRLDRNLGHGGSVSVSAPKLFP
jgi:hypothetical protein